MAKRFLNLKGAKAPKLELDYLRLLYAVKETRREGKEAQGYLLVMTSEISAVTSSWQRKYRAGDAVRSLVAPLSDPERSAIDEEIAANVAGMLAGSRGLIAEGQSNATLGASIAERYLALMIEELEPGVRRETQEKLFPYRVRWDYYGVLNLTEQVGSPGEDNK